MISSKTALLVIDVQRDFCPGGALAVPNGDEVVPVINDLVTRFTAIGAPVIFTRDWHPIGADHFKLWPSHCIANTTGADYQPGLLTPLSPYHVKKGRALEGNSYSGFDGDTDTGIWLENLLEAAGTQEVVIVGLATDYCVKATAIDAAEKGFNPIVVLSACRGVGLKAGDVEMAIVEMKDHDVEIVYEL